MDKLGKCVCCAYQKRRNVTKVGRNTEKRTFLVLEEGESFSTRVCSPCKTKVRTALRCFRKLEKNWTLQLKMNNFWDWKEWVNPLILIGTSSWFGSVNHYPSEFKHPAENANELVLAQPANGRRKAKPSVTKHCRKSRIQEHKENRLELFKPRWHFGEIKQPKTLDQLQWGALHF